MNNKSKMIPIMAAILLIGFFVAGAGELYAQSNKIICPQCGKENEAGAKFCWNDGFNLSTVQKQQITIMPVPAKIFIPLPKSQPEPATQTELSFGSMSITEMELFFDKINRKITSCQ